MRRAEIGEMQRAAAYWPYGSRQRGNGVRLARIHAHQHRMDGWSMTPSVREWQHSYAFMLRKACESGYRLTPFGEYVERVKLWPLQKKRQGDI